MLVGGGCGVGIRGGGISVSGGYGGAAARCYGQRLVVGACHGETLFVFLLGFRSLLVESKIIGSYKLDCWSILSPRESTTSYINASNASKSSAMQRNLNIYKTDAILS